MMGIMQEIYNQMAQKNIIDNDDFLEKLLDFYKTSNRPQGNFKNLTNGKKYHRSSDFYDFLTKESVQPDNSNINQEDYEKFYIRMTNKWILNVLSLSEQQLSTLTKNGLDGYTKIKSILQTKQQVNSMGDIKDLYDKMQQALGDDFIIEKNKYFWRHLQNGYAFNPQADYDGDFTHVISRYGNVRKENAIDVNYRLYINCANEDLFKIVSAYVDYCEKNGMEYYFKYQTDGNRQDKLLVYSSKEQLRNNIIILKQIAKDYPEIIKNCGPNLSLTGNIDDWIGVASEPNKEVMTHKQSFNTLRAEILEDAAEQVALDFINTNLNDEKIRNELINRAVNVIIEKMEDVPKELFTQEYINQLKITLASTIPNSNIRFIVFGFKRLKEVIPQKNDLIGTNSQPIFKIRQPDGKYFDYSIETADKVLKSMVDVMKLSDPNYLEKYRLEIKRKCQQYAVDPNNFSLNSSSLEDFKQLDSVESNLSLNSDDISEEHNNEYGAWNIQNFYYVRGILSTLSPEDLKLRIPFSNGMKISLEQYAEECLVSRMDENQNFITDTGETIPVVNIIRILVEKYSNQQELISQEEQEEIITDASQWSTNFSRTIH